MEFTEEKLDILSCLIENEIKSDLDYLDDLKSNNTNQEEINHWTNYVLILKVPVRLLKL